MASLRRKPEPDVAPATADPVVEPSAPSPAASPHLQGQLEALKNSEAMAQQAQQQAAAIEAVNRRCQEWVNQNELAQRHLGQLNDFHRNAIDSGYLTGTEDYFACLRDQLGALEARQHRPERMVEQIQEMAARQPEPVQPVPRPPVRVAAPPSRDPGYGSSPTSIRLTKEQSEFAKMSGISETEYAKELLRLNKMKAEGHYQERR